MSFGGVVLQLLLIFAFLCGCDDANKAKSNARWIDTPQSEWPQIAMINHMQYTDKEHPVAGCAFLLDTGSDTLAATAKHILVYFKSETMNSVSFQGTLRTWKMYPKNNPDDVVVVDKLINEDPQESIDRTIPPTKDWLLFTIKEKSPNIQPLKFRKEPFKVGEEVYIVGWRYSDKDCRQVIYEGNFVEEQEGSILISTKRLSDNTMPGLSGAPVIDAKGCVIGLMSQKAGKLERLSSTQYAKELLEIESVP